MASRYQNGRFAWVCLFFVAGCSEAGPQFAPVDGRVTFEGKPLSNATVTFVPEKGPVSMGITDLNGNFRVSSGTRRGVVVGPVRVSITDSVAVDPSAEEPEELSKPPETEAEAAAYRKKADEMQQAIMVQKRADAKKSKPKPKSIIPSKLAKVETSDLSYTIKANGDNHFKIDL